MSKNNDILEVEQEDDSSEEVLIEYDIPNVDKRGD